MNEKRPNREVFPKESQKQRRDERVYMKQVQTGEIGQFEARLEGDRIENQGGVYGQCNPVSIYSSYTQIGEGTYGTVYRAVHSQTSEIVALKRIILHNEITEGFPITSIREIATLRQIQHQNCIQLLDIVVSTRRDGVYLVFEYCEHDLSTILSAYSNAFTESETKSLILQLLSAIKYLHEHWIIHRYSFISLETFSLRSSSQCFLFLLSSPGILSSQIFSTTTKGKSS
jgi:serine/threonine protein kinase